MLLKRFLMKSIIMEGDENQAIFSSISLVSREKCLAEMKFHRMACICNRSKERAENIRTVDRIIPLIALFKEVKLNGILIRLESTGNCWADTRPISVLFSKRRKSDDDGRTLSSRRRQIRSLIKITIGFVRNFWYLTFIRIT